MLHLSLVIAGIAVLCPRDARAVDMGCVTPRLSRLLSTLPPEYAREYEGVERALFLSDGNGVDGQVSLGPRVALSHPHIQVVSGDVTVRATLQDGNFTRVHLDNRLPFQRFRDNEFDRIILRRGLCICHDSLACAGFCPLSSTAEQFLSEVARVLNKRKPGAEALLHGEDRVTSVVTDQWKAMAARIESRYPVRFVFNSDKNGKFHSITIRPR